MTLHSPTAILRNGLRFLVPLSLLLTAYLYLYPVVGRCAFPLPDQDRHAAFLETAKLHLPNRNNETNETVLPLKLAPFRLLALGDPQLEGDTSIPTDYLGYFPNAKAFFQHVTFRSYHPSLRLRIRQALHDLIDVAFEDVYNILESARKRIDLFGNDFYLAHIYRTLHWWTKPTHVTVLGDLVGSQWLDDAEFSRRANRFWARVFRGAERVPDDLALYPADEYDLSGFLNDTFPSPWSARIINVAGNHDIGYAGDININRTSRFEDAFGKINYELRFELPLSASSLSQAYDSASNPTSDKLVPELRIVVLNSMNLDTPASEPSLQDETYSFVNKVINTAAAVEFKGHYTVILTHVPLYKPAGICVDAPLFEFHDDGSLREQNQLSLPASKGFLEGILGMSGDTSAPGQGRGRKGIILNGHDHEGCDTWHFVNQTSDKEEKEWEVKRWKAAVREAVVGKEDAPGVRELTVRSMMGDFGGNAGLLSLWFDEEKWEWKSEFETCKLGRQHFWWFVHIFDLLVVVGIVLSVTASVLGMVWVDVDGLLNKSLMRLVCGCGNPVTVEKKQQ